MTWTLVKGPVKGLRASGLQWPDPLFTHYSWSCLVCFVTTVPLRTTVLSHVHGGIASRILNIATTWWWADYMKNPPTLLQSKEPQTHNGQTSGWSPEPAVRKLWQDNLAASNRNQTQVIHWAPIILELKFSTATARAHYLYDTIHDRQHLARDVALPQGWHPLLLHDAACCLGHTPVLCVPAYAIKGFNLKL
jgi:hypothetical protein